MDTVNQVEQQVEGTIQTVEQAFAARRAELKEYLAMLDAFEAKFKDAGLWQHAIETLREIAPF